jgi:carbon-monoxide dehydrogenase medium subunit
VAGLAGIVELEGGIAIGAMTRHREAERSQVVRSRFSLVSEALAYVGHPAIRNRGTVGGSLAHADPAAELPAVALVYDAQIVARSLRGERVIGVADFFQGYMTTALEPDELLVDARLFDPPAGSGTGFVELARRHGDYALGGCAALVRLEDSGAIAEARFAFLGADSRAVRVREAEESLRGAHPDEDVFREAAETAAARLEPNSDVHGSADYRRRVAAVVARRALVAAAVGRP